MKADSGLRGVLTFLCLHVFPIQRSLNNNYHYLNGSGRNQAGHTRLIQKVFPTTFTGFVATLMTGSLMVPTKRVVKYGKEVSPRHVAFLRQLGATVDSAIAKLGMATWMSSDRRAITYSWATGLEWSLVFISPAVGGSGIAPVFDSDGSERALFMAFDEHGVITRHALRRISGKTENETLDSGCRKWRQSRPVGR